MGEPVQRGSHGYSTITATGNTAAADDPFGEGGVGITPDPNTGAITVTPMDSGTYMIVMRVIDYDSLGNEKSEVYFDFLIFADSCSNAPPQVKTGGVFNVTVDGSKVDSSNVEVIAGDSLCFTIRHTDVDGDSVTTTTNASTVLNGSTETITNYTSDSSDVRVCWRADASSAPSVGLTITVRDDNCPINNQNPAPS